MFRGCTVVDPPSVLTTHLTEMVRETHGRAAVLRRDAEAAGRAAARAAEAGRRPHPARRSRVGGVQRVLQALLAERVSIRDLPTILEGIQEACGGGRARHRRRSSRMCAPGSPARSATRTPAPGGYIPLITLSPDWERPSPRRWSARRRTASSRWRRRGCRSSCSGCAAPSSRGACRRSAGAADQRRHPRPRARDRRAHPPGHAGAGAGGNLPARPHPHRGHDLSHAAPDCSGPPQSMAEAMAQVARPNWAPTR